MDGTLNFRCWTASWADLLEPLDFLKWQCTCKDHRASESEAFRYWMVLCAKELGVDVDRLAVIGNVPRSADASLAAFRWENPAWARSRQLFCDLDAFASHCELAQTNEYYQMLHSDAYAINPRHLLFHQDDRGLVTRCSFTGPLDGDRCVLTARPLPGLLAATALPSRVSTSDAGRNDVSWTLGYRSCSYYEVTIGATPKNAAVSQFQRAGHSQCISVGLCTDGISASDICYQQAGWNQHSWALHGDDGHLFHSNMSWDLLDGPVKFGSGDTVGCGLVHVRADMGATNPQMQCLELHVRTGARTDGHGDKHDVCTRSGGPLSRGIIFTKNGKYLGIGFHLNDDDPKRLRPCVGIDAHWPLDFNFGSRPFVYDIDAAWPMLDIELQFNSTSVTALRTLNHRRRFFQDVPIAPALPQSTIPSDTSGYYSTSSDSE
eukprot:TRINITY_DN9696_c0_g1_i1.p1 TRINITY_DN9696_c0_g1~~TRINITY_DN9696_c0_g1_i1.p1  ORF type:complete len:446 (-),score=46.64 TRINITY_DN9696_c0_g1_i1:86-1384(-)